MENEKLILERLDRIEAGLAPLARAAGTMNELKQDLTPLANHAVQMVIKELQDVESGFQLEDLLEMVKLFLRNVRNISYSLRQLGNVIDFINTLEPLLKSSVPQVINYLDDIEQKGVFRILNATLGIRAKIAEKYTPEDIDQIGDGLVALLGLAKKISCPGAITFLQGVVEIPGKMDLAASKEVGPLSLLFAGSNKEVKEGLGVLIELTKGLGKLRNNCSNGPAGQHLDSLTEYS
ncbi:MAG: hypothetical protein CVU57_04595 [Deltaproteobacteria bacterium HGW-Deltaproteobacteria-15]|jgi:uncharacterized protein YjgD (DUF1641 family)|nr:MAG: hypothetical protein CVU57_04595 [Deltaproteobacteria bacterium HGW-Deltaproteobacteria-15]